MPYVIVSVLLGLIWAGMQYFKGEITEPRTLAAHVIVFALFGVLMWGVRGVLLWVRQKRQGGS